MAADLKSPAQKNKKMIRNSVLLLVCVGLLASCRPKEEPTTTTPAKPDVVGVNVDTTVVPGDDFFNFANGGWVKGNPIPASESYWGIGKVLQEDIYQKMRKVSEDAAANANAAKGSNEQKIGDFWTTGIDSAAIEANGIKPIEGELAKIAGVNDVPGLLTLAAELHTYGVSVMFGNYVGQDDKQSDKNALFLYQGGLGLPNRDYYFNKDERNTSIRKAYKEHVAKMLELLGDAPDVAAKEAEAIFKLETYLAEKHRRLEELRDPYANYNKMTIDGLGKLSPSITWPALLANMTFKTDSVIVGQPEFFQRLDLALKKIPLADWKNYMRFHFISQFAQFLPSAFAKEDFHFYGETLEGRKEQKPRWKRVLDAQEDALGDALGQLFVKAFFPETAKKRYIDMVENVRTAFGEEIKELDWMSPVTKDKALDKLQKVTPKVGYPDKWKDFSAMTIDRSSYVRNKINADHWWFGYNAGKLNKPVDRTEWGMTPQTYNAYYNPSNNEIVLPAAILMFPGYEDSEIDDAVAYGYVAASTIGHEITHGFDDQGRQYDAQGNLKMWWTAEDSAQFAKRAQVLIDQFNAYVPIDTMHVRGEATLGENIADLGGIVIGLRAFKKTEQFQKGEKIAGYTPLQRFFMGYAYGWLGHMRDELLARQLMIDVHAPLFLRVNGPFSNVPEFYEAFNVQPSNKMYRDPATRARIW